MVSILDEKNKGYALGAADYMTKPIDRRRLSVILDKYRAQGGGRVLIVEDDETTRRMMRRMLVGEGWQVIEVAPAASPAA